MSIYDTGMYRAVEKAGGVAKLAEKLGVKRQAVYPWLTRGWAPAARAEQIETLYGIPRNELLSPKLRAVLSGTANAKARAGKVDYQPRKPVADEAADLV